MTFEKKQLRQPKYTKKDLLKSNNYSSLKKKVKNKNQQLQVIKYTIINNKVQDAKYVNSSHNIGRKIE